MTGFDENKKEEDTDGNEDTESPEGLDGDGGHELLLPCGDTGRDV